MRIANTDNWERLMTGLAKQSRVAVIGAGTMGSGIAQIAAQAGHNVDLYDVIEGAAAKAIAGVCSGLRDRVKAGKFEQEALDGITSRLRPASRLEDLASASLFIEAVAEDLATKRAFRET
jgi:3-hydroxybutyryl-CoA dehydrogenase